MISKKATLGIAAIVFISSVSILAAIAIGRALPRTLFLTAEEREWLERRDGTISFTGDPSYPPVDFTDERGFHDGISEDILSLLGKRLGVSFRTVLSDTWTAALQSVKDGEADALFAISEAPERANYLAMTESYLDLPTVFVALATDGSVRSPRDLSGKRVCITENYSSYLYFRDHNPGFTVIPVGNDYEGLAAVASGEADAALSDIPVISYFVSKKYISNLKIVGESGYMHRLAFGVRKDLPVLKTLLDKALASLTPREKTAVLERWIDVEYRNAFYETKTWAVMAGIFAGAAAVVLLAGLWDRALRALVRERTRELDRYKTRLEELVESRTRELTVTNRALEEAIDALEVLARTDTLTGCANRRAFLELAEREHRRTLRHGGYYGLMEFDLDRFKRVNDRFGHAAGDRALKAAAEAVFAGLRANDVFARLGGEEFFILLPDTDLERATATAERFRKAIAAIDSVEADGKPLSFTASFGVTASRPGDGTVETVMARGDAALYRAKEGGRDRVETG